MMIWARLWVVSVEAGGRGVRLWVVKDSWRVSSGEVYLCDVSMTSTVVLHSLSGVEEPRFDQ